jgi:hypothetical protein
LVKPLELPAKIEKLRRPADDVFHLLLRSGGDKRHFVFILNAPLAGVWETDGPVSPGLAPHPSQAMLRKPSAAPLTGLLTAPGLWELITADGSVLCISWRRKSRGVWWAREARLGGEPALCFPELDWRPSHNILLKRQQEETVEWRRNQGLRIRRSIAKLQMQSTSDDPELLRMLGRRASSLRGQTTYVDGFWCIPDWQGGDPHPLLEDGSLSVSSLVDRIFHRARRAEKRIEACAQRILKLEHELVGLEHEEMPVIAEKPATKGDPIIGEKGIKRFDLSDGHHLLVGRNAAANHRLTFKQARGRDLWFHLRDGPGSHVVLPLEKGENATAELLLAGASLALHYSSLRGERAEVRYAYRRDLEAVRGHVGKVLMRRENSLLVDPRQESTQRLLGSLGLNLR